MGSLRRLAVRAFTAAGVCLIAASGRAAVIWNSNVNGNLSENGAAPTPFTLTAGTNSIIGNVGGGTPGAETGVNQNWVSITIPAGFVLQADVLASYQSTDAQGFTGLIAGSSFTGTVNSAASYLGYSHYGTGATNSGTSGPVNLVGDDLLALMANPAVAVGATGFTDPLGAGTYTILIQQLGATTAYQFDFNVAPAPEPASLAVAGVAGAGLLLRRRRRSAV